MTTPAWISLGSNLGDRRAILDEAVIRLNQTPGVAVTTVSTYRETAPVGGPPGQGPFLNAAARLDTTLSPRELLGAMQAIERDLGRVRTVRWGERTLDLDILIYGCKFVDEPDLKLPHPRLAVRRFVLEPLAEIAPTIVDTITHRTVANILVGLDRQPRLLMVDESMAPWLTKRMKALAGDLAAILIIGDNDPPEPVLLTDPPVDDAEGRLFHRLDLIHTGVARLAVNHRWLVVNFSLPVRTLKTVADSMMKRSLKNSNNINFDEYMTRTRQLNRRLAIIPDPTLIVAAPGSGLSRKPGVSPTPIYWPEVTDPDAIVAEVVAVCRGIEGG